METGFLNETKSILKSLVISCPNGMTVDRLNRDYREMVGTWIPFKRLGYQSLELFLNGIPDTLVLTGYGRDARVGFVSNDKTQHINEMISHQKNTTRDRKTAVRTQPVFSSSSQTKSYGHPPPGAHALNSFNSRPLIPILPMVPQTFYQVPLVNVILRNTQPIQQKIYTNRPLNDINPNLNRNFKNKTTNLNETAKKQNNNTGNSWRMLNEPANSKNISIEVKNSSNVTTPSDDWRRKVAEKPNQQVTSKTKDNNITFPAKNNVENRKSFKESTAIISTSTRTTAGEDTSKINVNQQVVSKTKDDGITFPAKSNVAENRKPLKELPAPISTSTSPKAAGNRTSENDKIKITSHEKKNTSENNVKNSCESLKFPSKPAPNQGKFNSKKFTSEKVIKRPDLPTVSELQVSVEPRTKEAMDSKKEPSKKSFNAENINRTRFITDPFAQDDSSDNDLDEAVPEFAADFRVFHVDFPDDTVPYGKKIPNSSLPKDIKKGAVVGVFVSEIHSPFKFWFHLHKDHHELDVLMNGLENFYGRIGDHDLVIPKSCINPGQVCVALYNEIWHRAEILTNVSNNRVKVHFVDYGTVSEVDIDCIKYLRNCFAETPVQAIRGSLSHIKPNSPLWPKSAIQAFLGLVSEALLYAQIAEIDEKERTAYMVLCDTNSGQSVQINKLLVDRGFARLDSEWDEHKITENGYRKRHPRDIFPTFEMLETGEYPSLFEIEQLLARGIDYEKITEKIILSNVENSMCDERRLLENYSASRDKMSFHLLDTNPFKSDIISEIVSLKMFNK